MCLDIFETILHEASSLQDLKSKLGEPLSQTSSPVLASNSTKYLITLEAPFFHIIHDSLTLIFKLASEDPDGAFILYAPRDQSGSAAIIYDYLEDILNAKGISFLMLRPQPNDPPDDAQEYSRYTQVIEVSNFIKVADIIKNKDLHFSLLDYETTSNLLLEHLNLQEDGIEPYRKVYLSRSHIEPRKYKTFEGHSWYKDDQRMYEEHVLEDFFRSRGYEIVIPEEKFITFEDQVRYMRTVSVLASITSSGISNNLLMKNGQTVIEISAELVFPKGDNDTEQTLFNSYALTSYAKKHAHILIPSSRDPRLAISSMLNTLDSV